MKFSAKRFLPLWRGFGLSDLSLGRNPRRQLLLQPPRLLAIQPRLGQAFGGGLDRRQKAEQRQERAEHPQRQIERPGRQQQRAAAQHFEDRAGLAALGFRKPRGAGNVLRALGYPQRIERAAHASLFADAADVLGETDQRAGLLGAEGGLYRSDGLPRPQHRTRRYRILQHRRVNDLARRTAGPLREP